MFISSVQGASASTNFSAPSCLLPSVESGGPTKPPTDFSGHLPANGDRETIRHLLFGNLSAVQSTIRRLHQLNYAEPNDWSKPISTGRSNEVMAILTQRIRI